MAKIWNLRVQQNQQQIATKKENHLYKVVQMKLLAMHITNKNKHFDIFTVINVLNIFMEHDL